MQQQRWLSILFSLFVVAIGVSSVNSYAQEPKRIMVFGDSNSWGWNPVKDVVPAARYPKDVRWPGTMQKALGSGYEVVSEALPGRTTNSDDASIPVGGAGMNGAKYLPAALASHLPLDLVIIMLGTNDTKEPLKLTTLDIALGAMQLANMVKNTNGGVFSIYPNPKVLLIAPPPLGKMNQEWVEKIFSAASIQKSKELAPLLGALAGAAGIPFVDAGKIISTDGIDGIHFSAETQQTMGKAMAEKVKELLK